MPADTESCKIKTSKKYFLFLDSKETYKEVWKRERERERAREREREREVEVWKIYGSS